jgi:Cu(I)/Ag(I) efflux system membrane protein CusA/SilA
MISRIIAWCARNPFLVFTGAILLFVSGLWCMQRVPLDALPDISDVQVIIHTPWAGEPPNVIEDQVTYPIVTALLSAPSVKNVRAQTMFGDSYVFVVFQDGTDLYWARSRVIEYLQQIAGKLPADVHPAIGPDATGAGWVYEYALVERAAGLVLALPTRNRAGRSGGGQHWRLRAPVPGESGSEQTFLLRNFCVDRH